MDIHNYIPKDKSDTDAVERASHVGFPDLNPVIPELLAWMQDANWPVAKGVAELLSSAGPEIIPHIETILMSDDGIWKFWTLELVVRNLSPAIRADLQEELERLSTRPTKVDEAEKVDVVARSIVSA